MVVRISQKWRVLELLKAGFVKTKTPSKGHSLTFIARNPLIFNNLSAELE